MFPYLREVCWVVIDPLKKHAEEDSSKLETQFHGIDNVLLGGLGPPVTSKAPTEAP